MTVYGFNKEDHKRVASTVRRVEGMFRPTKERRRQKPVAVGSSAHVLYLHQVYDNYLMCRRKEDLDDDVTDEYVKVIKCEATRRSTWEDKTIDEITYTYESDSVRTASNEDDEEEKQMIIPPYNVADLENDYYGSEILCIQIDVESITDIDESDKEDAYYLEISNRDWGVFREET